MSDLKQDLEEWRLAQYVRNGERQTECEIRIAFHSLRFLQEHHERIANPWRDFLTPDGRAVSMSGERILLRLPDGYVVVVRWTEHRQLFVDDNGTGFNGANSRWMPIP